MSESVCSSVGSESLISYVLTAEMLAGGQRSRSGTNDSLRSQSSTFSDFTAVSRLGSTSSDVHHQQQQNLSPNTAKGITTDTTVECCTL